MTLEEQLKQEIVGRYGSVSAFSKSIGLSNSTVDSILSRGLYNAGVGRVMQIFDALGIDTESLAVGRIVYAKEQKKTPAPSEDGTGASEIEKEMIDRLVALGLIEEGLQLSDADVEFLVHVSTLISMWFDKRSQGE